ncbi:unnamed protein product [Protopolystoma xenopodis]|uniref:Uncharacterized protein n=1 Tax=Protopolystoma xenopodis TaxID=117903 RepID=A0A448WAF8_9PLAT|nr:unnamed protein product [Protopolystoma xenopodis]
MFTILHQLIFSCHTLYQIWANIQSKSEPWEISWDLTQTRHWLPLFPLSKTADRGPLTNMGQNFTAQPSSLNYVVLDDREVQSIKFELESVLRDSLMEWRKNQVRKKTFGKVLALATYWIWWIQDADYVFI